MARTAAEWTLLQEVIDGRVVLPESSEYREARKPAMVRFHDVFPEAVVACRSAADVSATITFARSHRLPIAIRGGGHSVAGHSSTDGVVLDMAPMNTVAVEGGVATVGAGVRLGDLHDPLQPSGVTVPAGSSHSVGIAGLALGGGLGILGRQHGLTCDHLLRAQVVLADGRIVECDERENEDLFWALRGAGGGNFGVVTSLVFRTVQAPSVTIFHLVWPLSRATELIHAWQTWAPVSPDELDVTLRLSANGDRPPAADLFGALSASAVDAAELLDELIARAGAEPASASCRPASYRDAKRYLDGVGPADDWTVAAPPPPRPQSGHLFTKSEFFRQLLPSHAIAALVETFTDGLVGGQSREVAFIPWGGAYNRVRADATAFVHRDERFVVQHLLLHDPTDTTAGEGGRDWLRRSWALIHPWGSRGVHPNFPDPDLHDEGHAYYGANYERLLRIKSKYDPDGFFSQRTLQRRPRRRAPLG